MKERQRWQPEEDALLRSYVKQHGPKEWNLISKRLGKSLNRDPKSCLERWKNYLKPGIKKGSLSPDEQSLVISLQKKYGNKWKKIAAEVPGRTAKRLGKWWEVFKEKQMKQLKKTQQRKDYSDPQMNSPASSDSPEKAAQGRYDHILETFAEKYVQPKIFGFQPIINLPDPVLSLGSVTSPAPAIWPPSLAISPSDPVIDPGTTRFLPIQQMGTLIQYCKELEEGRQSWIHHKKEAKWRLDRVEQQLESEKGRKMREIVEEMEERIRILREEENGFLERIESDYREEMGKLKRDVESKEGKLMEVWWSKHVKMMKIVEQIGSSSSSSSSYGLSSSKDL